MSGSPGSEGCLRQSQSSLRWLNLGAVPQLLCCSCTFHPVLSATSNLRPSSPWTAACDVLVNETERRSYVMWPFRGMFLAARRQEESPISQPADPVLASPVMAKKVECPPYFSPHRELNFIVQLWQCIQGQSHELRSAQGSEEIAFFF